MTKSTVYFRGLVEKAGVLYSSSINKKVNPVCILSKFKLFKKERRYYINLYCWIFCSIILSSLQFVHNKLS
jgi:hypothetical protein